MSDQVSALWKVEALLAKCAKIAAFGDGSPCHAMLCRAVLCCAVPCCAMPCCAILRYAELHCAALCYAALRCQGKRHLPHGSSELQLKQL